VKDLLYLSFNSGATRRTAKFPNPDLERKPKARLQNLASYFPQKRYPESRGLFLALVADTP
jgi:hypothetical protein